MATRLYPVANTAPPTTFATIAGWASTTGFVYRVMVGTKATTRELLSGTLSGSAGDNKLAVQLVSLPLDGDQTITGTYDLCSRGRELATTDNVDKRYRSVRVIAPDGTVRATILAHSASGSTTELSTTLTGQQHATLAAVGTVNALDGDRIVIELGYGESLAGTTPNWEMELGGTGTDHLNTNNEGGATDVMWIEFSQDLVFQVPEVTLTPVVITLSPVTLDPDPQPVSVNLTPVVITLAPVALAPGPAPVNVALTPVVITLSPVALDPDPQPVSVALTPVAIALSPVALDPDPQPVSIALTPVVLTLTPVALDPQSAAEPGEVALVPVTITLVPVALNPDPQPVSVALVPVSVALVPVSLGPVPGPVSVVLTPVLMTLLPVALTIGEEMPFPPQVDVVTVHGGPFYNLDSTPIVGSTIAFEVPIRVEITNNDGVIPPQKRLAVTDDDGEFTIDLPASDSDGLVQRTWRYKVNDRTGDESLQFETQLLVADGPTIEYQDLLPAP